MGIYSATWILSGSKFCDLLLCQFGRGKSVVVNFQYIFVFAASRKRGSSLFLTCNGFFHSTQSFARSMYSRNLDLCLFVKMSYVWGGGTFVKREGTTADKLDFALARAHSFEFSSMCSRFYKAVYAGNY